MGMGTGATPNPHKGPQIARIVDKAPKRPAQVKAYASQREFGLVPPFLREIRDELDAEQRYIDSLRAPREREGPRTVVRLLAQGEKDELIRGLRQQLQLETASCLAAKPGSKSRARLEATLEKRKVDIENLCRPYIFVEAL